MEISSSGDFCLDSLITNAAKEPVKIRANKMIAGRIVKLIESWPKRAIRDTMNMIRVTAPIQSTFRVSDLTSSIFKYLEERSN